MEAERSRAVSFLNFIVRFLPFIQFIRWGCSVLACLWGMGALHYRGTMIAGRSMGFPFAKGNEMGEQICKLCVGFRKMNLRFQKYPFYVSNMEDLFRLKL